MISKITNILFPSLTFIFFLTSQVFAEQNKPHVHGTSQLTIASENNILHIQLQSPLMDIVGFETQPKTKKQKESLSLAESTLKNWEKIFKFNGSSCKKTKIIVSSNKEVENHAHGHDHDHGKHKHKEQIVHNEIEAFYEFSCSKINKLDSLDIYLSDIFTGVEKVNVQWVSTDGQGQILLNKKQNRVIFR